MILANARAFRKAVAWSAAGAGAAIFASLSAQPAVAAAPQIRTSTGNTVPQCVTPQRLMAFLKSRNPDIDPRFARIAALYKRHGEAWRVRWDYAFFQMAVETNFLSFKRGDGSWSDVRPRQNNFAGLGTTGGGVPGDSYPDVGTGVLAQIQHLVVYSGEHVAEPVGPRTRLKQDAILKSMARFNGRTTFSDLARRWAADRHYGAAIEWVAGMYRAAYCRTAEAPAKATTRLARADGELPSPSALGGPGAKGSDTKAPPVRTIWSRPEETDTTNAEPAPRPAKHAVEKTAAPDVTPPAAAANTQPSAPVAATKPSLAVPAPVEVMPPKQPSPPTPVLQTASTKEKGPGAFAFAAAMVAAASAEPASKGVHCRVFSASFGGTKTLLVRAEVKGEQQYTALTVLAESQDSMLAGYLKAHAPGGTSIGAFDTRDAALAKASELCPASTAGEPPKQGASAG
jgi:hypothetical protein